MLRPRDRWGDSSLLSLKKRSSRSFDKSFLSASQNRFFSNFPLPIVKPCLVRMTLESLPRPSSFVLSFYILLLLWTFFTSTLVPEHGALSWWEVSSPLLVPLKDFFTLEYRQLLFSEADLPTTTDPFCLPPAPTDSLSLILVNIRPPLGKILGAPSFRSFPRIPTFL